LTQEHSEKREKVRGGFYREYKKWCEPPILEKRFGMEGGVEKKTKHLERGETRKNHGGGV